MSAQAPPDGVKRDFPIARLSTVRTGGAAEFFARAGAEHELLRLLRWARAVGAPVNVVGSGSNLLIADEGVAGLVLKLDRELASIERDDQLMLCGGGARLPAVAAGAARAGLSGIEFGVNIPGTVGGAVRMNANAYGGELARVLDWVEIVTAEGARRRGPAELGFAYRRSNIEPGQVVARACFALSSSDVATVKATLAEMRARRHEAQPQGIKTFGSTFKNPDDRSLGERRRPTDRRSASGPVEIGGRAEGRSAGQLLAEAGCAGFGVGGARFSLKHANFIENTGDASTADVLAVMAEGRRRVLERFGVELEPEVQALGDLRLPWL
jgi:UDP-N-acetylenolpyruvoylglucosamine reductase